MHLYWEKWAKMPWLYKFFVKSSSICYLKTICVSWKKFEFISFAPFPPFILYFLFSLSPNYCWLLSIHHFAFLFCFSTCNDFIGSSINFLQFLIEIFFLELEDQSPSQELENSYVFRVKTFRNSPISSKNRNLAWIFRIRLIFYSSRNVVLGASQRPVASGVVQRRTEWATAQSQSRQVWVGKGQR